MSTIFLYSIVSGFASSLEHFLSKIAGNSSGPGAECILRVFIADITVSSVIMISVRSFSALSQNSTRGSLTFFCRIWVRYRIVL